MSDLTILTISNQFPGDPKLIYPQFLASVRRYGYEPVIVGDAPGEFAGLGSRPRIIQRAIERGLVPTKYMIFSDAWDVVFAEHPDKILEWFLRKQDGGWEGATHTPQGCYPRIIWNAEKNCFPDGWQADRHPPAASGFRYLNSGFAVGETQAFLDALIEMKAMEIANDYVSHEERRIEPCCQAYWMREFLRGPVPMALDTNCEMCLTMHDLPASDLNFSGERILHKPTGTYPMAFHFNGAARSGDAIVPVLKHLGYERVA